MSEVVKKIAEEIRDQGAIPFRRFMELALYCPVCGYYEKEGDSIGRGGDYYTSVSVGSLFGELLGFQFAEWLGEAKCGINAPTNVGGYQGGGERVRIVEGGAHGGELAGDILAWIRRERPEVFGRLDYWIVEPSERRREWQRRKLSGLEGKVRWASTLSELGEVRGVIFCNELLDAMPVERLGWDAKRKNWFEWGVRMEAGKLEWTRMEVENPKAENRKPKVLQTATIRNPKAEGDWRATVTAKIEEVLPDGFTVERSPAAETWWGEAARVLGCGRLITIDYGLTEEELFVPERRDGTVRAYRQHRAKGDVLADPGQQDITAHVNFSAIQSAGEAAGLRTEAVLTQAQFLTDIAARVWKSGAPSGEWTAGQRRQFQMLTHPEHLGRAFRVLVQKRGE